MLDFEEFKKEVADNIKDFLPPEYLSLIHI